MKRSMYICLAIVSLIWGPNAFADDDSWMLFDDSQVAVVEITIDPASLAWMYDPANLQSDSMHVAAVHFSNAYIDETIEEVGMRLRGNTSRDAAKKSFKLSFNTFVDGREFYDVDKLNLNGEHNDPSVIRSKLCWDLYREIGMTASRAAHADVYINGNYYGLYISVEHIDDEFLDKNYADPSGNLWKCLYPADLNYLGDNPDNYKIVAQDRRVYDLKTNEDDDDYSDLAHLIDIINNTPDYALADSLETILVVPEFLKYMAMDVLTGSWDDYWFLTNNYYLYHEPARGLFHWIPYDYDNTFGVDWFSIDWAAVDPYYFGNWDHPPLVERVMTISILNQYRNLYSHFLEFYRDQVFELTLWEDRLDSLKAMISPSVPNDPYYSLDWGFTPDDFHNSYTAGHYENQHVKRGLKEYVNLRVNSLAGQISYESSAPIIYWLDWWPRHPLSTDTIWVDASAFDPDGLESVEIAYFLEGVGAIENYPMTYQPEPGTKQVEKADRWRGFIPPLGQDGLCYLSVVATDQTGWEQEYPRHDFIPIIVVDPTTADVILNEFMADNTYTMADPAGEYEDWLEIYNPTYETVYLSGMYLTDKPDNLTKWQFPFGGAAIAPHEYMVIWCDEDDDQSGIHTNFKLSADGEFLALVAQDGVTVLDSITFGPQEHDISYGRMPDNTDVWGFLDPSPGSENVTLGLDGDSIQFSAMLTVYPNPTATGATIRYELAQASDAALSVYNVAGQKVWSISQTASRPGPHEINWSGQTSANQPASPGLYFVEIIAGDLRDKAKLVIIR